MSTLERRTYQVLWFICFIAWLALGIMMVFNARELVFWGSLSFLASIGAVIFGVAVRYKRRVWPISLLFPRVGIH